MFVTITSNRTSPHQTPEIEDFLGEFLPRLRAFRGVRAIHHFLRPDHGDDVTIIIWDNEDAVKAYRVSELIREVAAFEQSHNTRVVREGYPLAISLP